MNFAKVSFRLTASICLLLSTLNGNAQRPPEKRQSDPQNVSYCRLIKSWKAYDHRIIKTEVIYATGPETSEIYDVGCPFLDKASWVDLSSDIKKASDPDLIERLNQNLEVNKRARVVVVGEFDGPKQVAVPPNTPASVAALMRAVNSRYGHQNMYNFRFLILKVEKVESVDKTEIWPRWAAKGKR